MIGILLMSHGKMADGLLDTSKLFFGDDIENIKAICLENGDDPEVFDERIVEGAKEIDDGSGVIALCDLLGGTPSNRSMFCLNERLQVITGMNLPMLLELLGERLSANDLSEIDIERIIDIGRTGIIDLNDKVQKMKTK